MHFQIKNSIKNSISRQHRSSNNLESDLQCLVLKIIKCSILCFLYFLSSYMCNSLHLYGSNYSNFWFLCETDGLEKGKVRPSFFFRWPNFFCIFYSPSHQFIVFIVFSFFGFCFCDFMILLLVILLIFLKIFSCYFRCQCIPFHVWQLLRFRSFQNINYPYFIRKLGFWARFEKFWEKREVY